MILKFKILLLTTIVLITMTVYSLSTDIKHKNIYKDQIVTKKEKNDSIINKDEIILIRRNICPFSINPKNYPDVKKLIINGCFFKKELVLEFKKLEVLEVEIIAEGEPCDCPQKLIDLEDIIKELKNLKYIKIHGGTYNNRYIKIPESISELKNLKSIWLETDLYPISIMLSKSLIAIGGGGISEETEMGNLTSFFYVNDSHPYNKIPKKFEYRRKIHIPKNGTYINYYDTRVACCPEPNHKIVEGNFVNGKPDGKWTFWFYEGMVSQVRYYSNGVETGDWKVWDRDGSVIAEYKFNNGKLLSYKKNNKD